MAATNRKPQRNSLILHLFGGPRLWREGDTVKLSPNQDALLAIAFNSDTGWVPRALVLRLLWDDRTRLGGGAGGTSDAAAHGSGREAPQSGDPNGDCERSLALG